MNDLVPDDIARRKQKDLGAKLAAAKSERADLTSTDANFEKVIHVATTLLSLCGAAYARADDLLRRGYNQAWFSAVYIDVDDDDEPMVNNVERTEFFEAVREARVFGRVPGAAASAN